MNSLQPLSACTQAQWSFVLNEHTDRYLVIKYYTDYSFDLTFTIHPDEEMNVCTTCHDNPLNSCRDTSLKTPDTDLMEMSVGH